MFSRGLQLAALAAMVTGSRNSFDNWPQKEDILTRKLGNSSLYGEMSRHRYPTEDLTKRPTPSLAPEKPLTKRQKRRLRGKQ